MYQTPTKPRQSTSTPIKRAPSLAKTIEKPRVSSARMSTSGLSTSSSLSQSKRHGGLAMIQQLASLDGTLPDIEEPEGVYTNLCVIINNIKSAETVDWTVELTAALYIRQLAQQHAQLLLKSLAACIRFLIKMLTSPRPSVVRPALLACIDVFESEVLQSSLKSLVVNQKLVQVMTLVSGRTGSTNDSLIDQSLFAVCRVVAHRGVRTLCEQLVVKGDRYYSNRLFSAGGLLTCLNYIPDEAKHKQRTEDVLFLLQTLSSTSDIVGVMREIYAEILARLVVVAEEEGKEAMLQLPKENIDKLELIWKSSVVQDASYVRAEKSSNSSPKEDVVVAGENEELDSNNDIPSTSSDPTFFDAFQQKIVFKKQKKSTVETSETELVDDAIDATAPVETPSKRSLNSSEVAFQSPPPAPASSSQQIQGADSVVTADAEPVEDSFVVPAPLQPQEELMEQISHLDLPPSPSLPTRRHVSPQWLSLHRPQPTEPAPLPQLPLSLVTPSQRSNAPSLDTNAVTLRDIAEVFDQAASLVSLKPDSVYFQGNKIIQLYQAYEKRRQNKPNK